MLTHYKTLIIMKVIARSSVCEEVVSSPIKIQSFAKNLIMWIDCDMCVIRGEDGSIGLQRPPIHFIHVPFITPLRPLRTLLVHSIIGHLVFLKILAMGH